MNDSVVTHFGSVALIGRPNVGKTTLLNALVGEKLAAITRKPHTTRNRIVGLISNDTHQIALLDTPGIDPERSRLVNRVLNQAALGALAEADIVCHLVEAGTFDERDEYVFEQVRRADRPTVLVVNKIDRVADKQDLLPYLAERTAAFDYHQVVPISAARNEQIDVLVDLLRSLLPEGPFGYDPETLTDRPERFRAEEIIREQLMLRLGQELPYAVAVQIEDWQETAKTTHIDALILVERDSQKGIVIGKGGAMLKEVGQAARTQMEYLMRQRIMLRLTVRVQENWTQNPRWLRTLGIEDR